MEDINSLGIFVSAMLPVKTFCIAWQAGRGKGRCGRVNIWKPEGNDLTSEEITKFKEASKDWSQLFEDKEYISGEGIVSELPVEEENTLLFAVCYDNYINGIFLVEKETGRFLPEEIPILHTLSELIGKLIHTENSLEEEKFSNFVFNTMLDGLKAGIYVTNPADDRILFMNQAMKEQYGISNPEGEICWKVLQNGMTGRCPFCPVIHFGKEEENTEVFQWEEISTLNGRFYRNYDSMIHWIDGSPVHLQQSIDITELKSANTDDLTQLLVRRPGKEALRNTINQSIQEGSVITVCLYDINLLKETNDKYGHAEGDKLIISVVKAVQEELKEKEYSFRLSGDEFIVVFACTRKEAFGRMNHVLEKLSQYEGKFVPSFCFGLTEITPANPLSVDDALLYADEQMYEQKRKFHIFYNEQRRNKSTSLPNAGFSYDTERLYDALVQSTDDYIYVCNMKTGVFKYTQAMIEEFELPSQVIENAAAVWGAKVHKEDRSAFLEANQIIADGRSNAHCLEYRALNRRGEWVWVRCRGHMELDEEGNPSVFAGFITNLGKKSKIDHLTGLFNKLEFEEQIRYLLESDSNYPFGIIVLGIDDIKHINNLYDRAFGDEVIRIVAQKIQTILPESASIYRLDGDEFGIIYRRTGGEGLKEIYDRIYRIFEHQQEYDGKKYYSTLSAGCAVCPEDAQNYADLIKHAGYAMEHAKNQGKKNCVFFSAEILNYRKKSLEMIEALRESIDNHYEGFSLRYQPLVNADTGKVMGFEALARWNHEKFGEVPPLEFIPLLEGSGLIIPAGKWILETALHECRDWVYANPKLEMNINISYLQLEGPNFVSFLKERISKEKFPPGNLILEMTESVLAKEGCRVQKIFEEIRKMGIRIAMDDFGTGYSALGILKSSPADIVKIDKAFIKDILTSNFDATFIKFVVALCHDVGIKVCLEGVETMEEYGAVSPMGLDMIQGYYFGYPMESKDFYEKCIKGYK